MAPGPLLLRRQSVVSAQARSKTASLNLSVSLTLTASFLTQLQQQLSDNQSDIDSLRGQIQENQYQLNQVMERQKQIMLQLGSLNNGGAAQPAAGDQSGAATTATPPRMPVRQPQGRRYKVAMRIPITMRQLRWCRISLARMMRLWRFRTSSRNTLILLISRTPIIGWAS